MESAFCPRLFDRARELLNSCPCADGCPSCIGATAGVGAKQTLLRILDELPKGKTDQNI